MNPMVLVGFYPGSLASKAEVLTITSQKLVAMLLMGLGWDLDLNIEFYVAQ